MKVLIIGSGAREHAIAKAILRSPQKPTLYCFANSVNPGIYSLAKNYFLGNICDHKVVSQFAVQNKIDFAIIGPEAPLEAGVADALWKHTIPVIGPKKILAQIETSKAFTRDLLTKYKIPGAIKYKIFHNLIGVKAFLEELGEGNYVVKADGLMGGKGVKVAGDHLHTIIDAYHFCQELHDNNMSFVIEEKLIGQEFSFLNFCDGTHLVPMPLIQDHKRAYINDEGPNTGGMGSYSDANHSLPFVSKEDIAEATKINTAVIKALMQECNEKYIGILYGSFMITKDGVKLIEYNARFGDPEVMNILSILKTDFLQVCQNMIAGKLTQVEFANLATVCKYAVPEGYPDKPIKNSSLDISHIKNPEHLYLGAVDVVNNQLVATGSRTAAVVGIAETIFAAEEIAEQAIQQIKGSLFHRQDIGTKALIEKRINHMQEIRKCPA